MTGFDSTSRVELLDAFLSTSFAVCGFQFLSAFNSELMMVKEKMKKVAEAVEVDAIDVVNGLELGAFVDRFLMTGNEWKSWTHPVTKIPYTITIQTSTALSKTELDSCFNLVHHTSFEDYKKSKDGWKPRFKRKEMQLLDLKYLLVKDQAGNVEGFCSFMPTYEDGYAVIYCYEIHLRDGLQRTGLGKLLMSHIEFVAARIPEISKTMLTVFTRNERAVKFYEKLEYEKDEFSPPPRILRNGTKVEHEYLILSKAVLHSDILGM